MSIDIKICKDLELGTWQGMGGAITEAVAYNFAKLSPAKQQKLLDAYYGKNGLDYRWGRISIGSNDFCLKPFEYTKRTDLNDFSIEHDQQWLLPMLQKIVQQKPLKFIASPWSPPSCLKVIPKLRFGGLLAPWNYARYAKYIHKWLDAYANHDIKVKYLTPQNEPRAIQPWESCFFSYNAQKKPAYKFLANELRDTDVQILLWDHNKKHLAEVADRLITEECGSDKKVAGICYHWYNGTFPEQMWEVHQKHPDILMISSEMCCGAKHPYDEQDWKYAAKLYYRELFADINSGTNAWIDWNMLLSWQGGPSHCKNYVKSPVILTEAEDDFVLTPIYDALKKFAKLFPAGSQIVRCEYDSDDVVAVARKTKAGYEVVVANISGQTQVVDVAIAGHKKQLSLAELDIQKIIPQR
ncbi:hypothetical protein J6X15_02210 [Candidatus Saccharibacteria bacterium]|nr:hypothetical protein [Candidatus Saccharibacteria bacterium]